MNISKINHLNACFIRGRDQLTISEVARESVIEMNHELVLLLKRIDWDAVEAELEAELEAEFAEYYCADNGRR